MSEEFVNMLNSVPDIKLDNGYIDITEFSDEFNRMVVVNNKYYLVKMLIHNNFEYFRTQIQPEYAFQIIQTIVTNRYHR